MKRSVVVTGIGLITPLSPFGSPEDFWCALCSGTDAIKQRPSPMLDTGREWFVAGIDADVSNEEKFFHLANCALRSAINDAAIEGSEAGLAVGTVLGNVLSKQMRLIKGYERLHGSSQVESLSYPAIYLSKQNNLEGPVVSVSTACASGTDAVGLAARKIIAGTVDIMVAGGVDVLSDFALTGFHALQALTATKVRPFDKNRSGLALGEGAAFLVLESLEHALNRNAKLYGRVLGYSSRVDAHHLTAPHREGRGLADAAFQAISQADLESRAVNYINAHGTGTVYNDLMETKVIKHVFGKFAYEIPVSSTKSMLGHSFGAAGAIEIICCLFAIRDGKIPPTINYEERDPECDLDYVPNESRLCDVKCAMSFSAGFGGQNSAIILGAVH